MSRIGLEPITIEEGIEVKIEKDILSVSGDGKELTIQIPKVLEVKIEDNIINISRKDEEKKSKSIH